MNGQRVPGCTGKKKYGTQAHAQEIADTAPARSGRAVTLYVYQCRACHCWHLSTWTPERAARDEANRTRAVSR